MLAGQHGCKKIITYRFIPKAVSLLSPYGLVKCPIVLVVFSFSYGCSDLSVTESSNSAVLF